MKVVTDFLFFGSKIIADGDSSHEIRRWLLLDRNAMRNLDSVLKSRDITVLTKVHIVNLRLSSGHVWLWELDCKEGRVPENRCCQTVVLEKTPESPLDSKEIQAVNLKGNQHWILVRRTDAEGPLFWSSDANSWLIWQVPDVGKDWGQKEKRASEDEKAGWHHQCNENELGRTSGDGEGQGDLPCCSPWGHKESNTAGQLNNNIAVGDLSTHLSVCVLSCSVVLDSLWPHGLLPARFLSPRDFPGKTTGVGCHFLLQGIFPT